MARRSARKRLFPKYVKWREGRPRWELGGSGGQKLRAAGWQSIDLKDQHGDWLSFEQAKLAGKALNAAVAKWRAGDKAPDPETIEQLLTISPEATRRVTDTAPAMLANAPSTAHFMAKPARPEFRTLSDYIDAHQANLATKSKGTQINYKRRAKPLSIWLGQMRPGAILPHHPQRFHQTLLDVSFWKAERADAGDVMIDAHTPYKTFTRARKEATRARRLDALDVLDDQRDAPGFNMAHGVCVYARLMWSWARRNEGLTLPNPFTDMDLTSPRGRVRYIEPEEVMHLVETADANGMPEVGDIVIAALQTVQRGSDQIRLTWQDFDRGHFDITQQKGKKPVRPPVTEALRRRAQTMRARQAAILGLKDPKLVLGPMLRDANGQPYTARDPLTEAYAKLRALAGETMPSLIDSKLHDMRDTGFTRVYMANDFDLVRACQVSGHSLGSADMIVKSYLAQRPEIAKRAGEGYDEWMASNGVKW